METAQQVERHLVALGRLVPHLAETAGVVVERTPRQRAEQAALARNQVVVVAVVALHVTDLLLEQAEQAAMAA